MPVRTLYCRHPNCDETVEIEAGQFPPICRGCKRDAMWSTTPGQTVKVRKTPAPKRRYVLSYNDRRFLRSLRIDPADESV